jgi:hypothetical protein
VISNQDSGTQARSSDLSTYRVNQFDGVSAASARINSDALCSKTAGARDVKTMAGQTRLPAFVDASTTTNDLKETLSLFVKLRKFCSDQRN